MDAPKPKPRAVAINVCEYTGLGYAAGDLQSSLASGVWGNGGAAATGGSGYTCFWVKQTKVEIRFTTTFRNVGFVIPLQSGMTESWLFIIVDSGSEINPALFVEELKKYILKPTKAVVVNSIMHGNNTKKTTTAATLKEYCKEHTELQSLEFVELEHTQEGLLNFREQIVASLQKAHPEFFLDALPTTVPDSPSPASDLAFTATALRSPKRKTTVDLDEMRVVILGDPAVGKTSLLMSVTNSEKSWIKKNLDKIGNKPLLSTDGIDISSLQIGSGNLTLNFWDFAGQELYLVSHQFFLGERALYLILFDARQTPLSQSRIAFWVRSLHTRVPFADVVLIGTHTDDPRCTSSFIEKQKKEVDDLILLLKRNHPIRVHGVFWIDTKSGNPSSEVARLKELMNKVAKEEIPNLLQTVDIKFITFRDELQRCSEEIKKELKPPIMLWSELLTLGTEKQGLNEATTIVFLQIMQAQGRVIYHTNKDKSTTPSEITTSPTPLPSTPRQSAHQFDNIVILDASWFNKTVLAAVITSRHTFVKEGKIAKQDLIDFVWRGVDPKLIQQFLFLLERYEILFPCDDLVEGDNSKDDTSKMLLVPSQLESGGPNPNVWGPRPGANEPAEAQWLFQLKFVPEGLFSRIIARIHQLKIKQKAWRTCTLLNRDGHRALVKLEPPSDDSSPSVLRITVRGVQPDNLMDILVNLVEQLITRWYPGLQPSAHVLCTECPAQGADTLCTIDVDKQLIPSLANPAFSDLTCNQTMCTLSPSLLAAPLISVLLHRIDVQDSVLYDGLGSQGPLGKAKENLQKMQDSKRNKAQDQQVNLPEGTLQEILSQQLTLLREIREEQHRAWARQIKLQLDVVQKHCPILFMLLPDPNDGVAQAAFRSLKSSINLKAAAGKLLKNTFRLHLMCEHSSKTESGLQWHTIPDHHGYTVENLRKFVAKVAPFARAMLHGIKPLLALANLSPLKIPDISSGIDAVTQMLRNPMEGFPLMEMLLEGVREEGEAVANGADLSPASLREWTYFLNEIDPKSNFAGLEQVAVLATGEVRWLCPKHAAAFKTHYSF